MLFCVGIKVELAPSSSSSWSRLIYSVQPVSSLVSSLLSTSTTSLPKQTWQSSFELTLLTIICMRSWIWKFPTTTKNIFFFKVELLSVIYLSIFRPDEGYSRNVPDEGYSRNAPCTLNYISTFSFKCKYYQYLIDQKLFW
jgi:hypothetical protein